MTQVGVVPLLVLSLSVVALGTPKAKDAVMDVLMHRCAETRALDFKKVTNHVIFGKWEDPSGEGVKLAEIVDHIEEVNDALDERMASIGKLRKMFDWFSSTEEVAKWHKDLEDKKAEAKALGFNYDGVKDRCHHGHGTEADKCMLKHVPRNENHKEMYLKVEQVLNINSYLIHHIDEEEKSKQTAKKDELLKWLEENNFDFDTRMEECSHTMKDEAEAVKARVTKELMAAKAHEEADGHCHELEGRMCPAGTWAATQMQYNHARGATAFTITYLFGKLVLTPAAAVAGSAFGPAGAAAGVIAGGSVASWIVIGATYFASLGPYECACFPRPCEFDNITQSCAMVAEDEAPSHNPFARSLPVDGTKCQMAYGKADTCLITPCGDDDYDPLLCNQDRTQCIYGKLGKHGKDIFNCASKSRRAGDSLMFQETLPNGESNTAENREKLYAAILAPQTLTV